MNPTSNPPPPPSAAPTAEASEAPPPHPLLHPSVDGPSPSSSSSPSSSHPAIGALSIAPATPVTSSSGESPSNSRSRSSSNSVAASFPSSSSSSLAQSPRHALSPPSSLSSVSTSSTPPSPIHSPSSSSSLSSLSSTSTTSSTTLSSSSSSSPDDASILFLGDLSRAITESDLSSLFAAYGPILSIDVKRDKVTGNNLGYGFLHLAHRSSAERAKRELSGVELLGRRLRIGWAQKNTTLFIGDLDGTVTSDDLRRLFAPFGPVIAEETFVKSAPSHYGFVRFQTRADAERAKAHMNRSTVGSRPIRIGWGDNNIQKHCVHVQLTPPPPPAPPLHDLIDEAVLVEAFGRFGEVVSVGLPRGGGRRLKGFAFIHYAESEEGEQSAGAAVSTMGSATINGVGVKVSYGKRQTHPRYRSGRSFPPTAAATGGGRGGSGTVYAGQLSPASPPYSAYPYLSPTLHPSSSSLPGSPIPSYYPSPTYYPTQSMYLLPSNSPYFTPSPSHPSPADYIPPLGLGLGMMSVPDYALLQQHNPYPPQPQPPHPYAPLYHSPQRTAARPPSRDRLSTT